MKAPFRLSLLACLWLSIVVCSCYYTRPNSKEKGNISDMARDYRRAAWHANYNETAYTNEYGEHKLMLWRDSTSVYYTFTIESSGIRLSSIRKNLRGRDYIGSEKDSSKGVLVLDIHKDKSVEIYLTYEDYHMRPNAESRPTYINMRKRIACDDNFSDSSVTQMNRDIIDACRPLNSFHSMLELWIDRKGLKTLLRDGEKVMEELNKQEDTKHIKRTETKQ